MNSHWIRPHHTLLITLPESTDWEALAQLVMHHLDEQETPIYVIIDCTDCDSQGYLPLNKLTKLLDLPYYSPRIVKFMLVQPGDMATVLLDNMARINEGIDRAFYIADDIESARIFAHRQDRATTI